jgi:hypothetical protein
MSDILPSSRGEGEWLFDIYNPNKIIGPIQGYLLITKEHHTVFSDSSYKTMILSIPSQNVAIVQRVKNDI